MIIVKNLKPKEISFLQLKNTLYVSDLRAIGESMEYEIPSMWKYENLLPWILIDKDVAINENGLDLKYIFNNRLLVMPTGNSAKKSIFEKLASRSLPSIRRIWVAVPHPAADEFAEKHNLKLNYSYSEFLDKNDKFKQKKLLARLTPKWKIIDSYGTFEKLTAKRGFVKRRHGSGGYTVFDINLAKRDANFLKLFNQNPGDWFFEEFVEGKPHSIQCLVENNKDITIFGFSEQKILNAKNFFGSDIIPLKNLQKSILLQLSKGIIKLKPLLNNYKGFFGIDFIIDKKNKVYILEANIRLTAATIPTLLTNMVGSVSSAYTEDATSKNTKSEDVVLTIDKISGEKDILRFYPAQGPVGKYFCFDFKNCGSVPKELSVAQIEDLSGYIQKYVCGVVGKVVKNFWPFGWTVCFILEESHCVISGWYLEKRVLVDIFCCNLEVKTDKLKEMLSKFFISEVAGETKEVIK